MGAALYCQSRDELIVFHNLVYGADRGNCRSSGKDIECHVTYRRLVNALNLRNLFLSGQRSAENQHLLRHLFAP